jgi:hypothetical protein
MLRLPRVHKQGISDLRKSLSKTIRPTPEVVNRGFQRIVFNFSRIEVLGPCILLDIGGATTDLHYTTDIIREDSEEKASTGSSVARYVFTDLGIVASRNSTLLQLRGHPLLYDLLVRISTTTSENDVPSTKGRRIRTFATVTVVYLYSLPLIVSQTAVRPGFPSVDLGKAAQIILTGGAAQILNVSMASRVVDLFVRGQGNPRILIDRCDRISVDGITWSAIR